MFVISSSSLGDLSDHIQKEARNLDIIFDSGLFFLCSGD